ncbi:hypothetical protein [Spiroplasma floricola]|uniref:Uncharacterized protein n=1 Tax=Spiroplasma floricola 23-6 TaxID=1336749 RepID=A0A2K8SFB3_9MOLU|nr:hypothetical protein [Spiroplasma floricola]AUB32149.1 hypothetical protein SFLOR_v1c11030 [Spiroplasma floricola 23-6]
MKRVSTKSIAICGLITSLMFGIGALSTFISNISGKNIFQISDTIYLSLLNFLNPFLLITSASISGILIDLYAGGFIYMPITVIVKILIGITFILLKKFIPLYLNIFISYIWIFIYVLYAYLIFDSSVAIVEVITDSIQYSFTVVFASIFCFSFNKVKLKQKIIDKNETELEKLQ